MTLVMHRRDIPEIEVLRAARALGEGHRARGWTPYIKPGEVWNLEQALSQYPIKVLYARLEQLSLKGYLDWGVTLRTAGLSEKGEQRLRELEAEHGTDS